MLRPAVATALLAASVAACSSGFNTGQASLTGISPMIQSAGAYPFTGSDGGGTDVLGWELEFFTDAANMDCNSSSLTEIADLYIYTPQPASNGGRATLGLDEVEISPDNPPTIVGNADVAHFVNASVTAISGTLNITSATDKEIEGMVDAAGTLKSDGTDATISGTFTATVCE
jgi:hypothetical protein